MTTDKKLKILTWAVIILLVLNASTIITIIIHNYQFKQASMQNTYTSENFPTGNPYNGRYFINQLNFSDHQIDLFRKMNQIFRQQSKAIAMQLFETRKQMYYYMINHKPDTILLNNFADSIGFLHSKLKKETYQFYFQLKSICNKQQKEKLDSIFYHLLVNDKMMGGNGQGYKKGMRMYQYRNSN